MDDKVIQSRAFVADVDNATRGRLETLCALTRMRLLTPDRPKNPAHQNET
ncbi:MAG TPA: hypothetical protein VH500_23725 [Nitrososphaeraceae archaeon]